MEIKAEDTALVVTDPQNDVLSEEGVAWPHVDLAVKAPASHRRYLRRRSERTQSIGGRQRIANLTENGR